MPRMNLDENYSAQVFVIILFLFTVKKNSSETLLGTQPAFFFRGSSNAKKCPVILIHEIEHCYLVSLLLQVPIYTQFVMYAQ